MADTTYNTTDSSDDSTDSTFDKLGISLLDLEDIVADQYDTNDTSLGVRSLSADAGGKTTDNYRHLGSFTQLTSVQKYIDKVLEESFRLMGQGKKGNILQNFLSRLDRHGSALVPPNTLNYGFTFITRPRLNLTGGNLAQVPHFASLKSNEMNSVPFMIRALLDTVINNHSLSGLINKDKEILKEVSELSNLAEKSSLVDTRNPFLIPLCNGLKAISGWPDFTLETETTEGDFHSGDFTFVKGSDMLNRATELSLEFRDIQGGIVIAIIYYWVLYMAYQAKGVIVAYPDDIYEQRLNYTVSIYRFITDPTRRYVLWWSKATGCYPKSVPVGALFNVNQGEVSVSSAANYSVPFVANKIEYNHPGILYDFNTLICRYNAQMSYVIQNAEKAGKQSASNMIEIPVYSNGQLSADIRRFNFMGIPFLVPNNQGIELKWYTSEEYCDSSEEFAAIKQMSQSTTATSSSNNNSTNTSTTTTGMDPLGEVTEKEFNSLFQEVANDQAKELEKALKLFSTTE